MDRERLHFIASRHVEARAHLEPAGQEGPEKRKEPQPYLGKHLAHPTQEGFDITDGVNMVVPAHTAGLLAGAGPHVLES